MNVSRKARKGVMVLTAVTAVLGFTACSGEYEDTNISELTARGFTNPIVSDSGAVSTYHADAGQCRIRIKAGKNTPVTVLQGDLKIEDANLVSLQRMNEFAHCFEGDTQSG